MDERRQHLLELASKRCEVHYHSPTNTHIVIQLSGTEFTAFSTRGVGDMADEAFADYHHNLLSLVSQLKLRTVTKLIEKLERVPQEIKNCRTPEPT